MRDQRAILTFNVKPLSTIFIQNAQVEAALTDAHARLWVENSHVSSGWQLKRDQVITGVPPNDWKLHLPRGVCLDVAPVGERQLALRAYGIDDTFRGALGQTTTRFMNRPFGEWFATRGLALERGGMSGDLDIHQAPLFPVLDLDRGAAALLAWLLEGKGEAAEQWPGCERLSGQDLAARIHLGRLHRRQTTFCSLSWPCLAKNAARSVFLQVDPDHAAREYVAHDVLLPPVLVDGRRSPASCARADVPFAGRALSWPVRPGAHRCRLRCSAGIHPGALAVARGGSQL